MPDTWHGSGSASWAERAKRVVREAVRVVKLEAKNDAAFVPVADDSQFMLAARIHAVPRVVPPPPVDETSAMLAARIYVSRAIASGRRLLTFGAHLTGGSYDGSVDVTLGTDATPTNTVSTIVSRDANGDFLSRDVGFRHVTATDYAGVLVTAAQPNVTSLGTLLSLLLAAGVAPSLKTGGANAVVGTVLLVAGTATVNTTAMTASALLFPVRFVPHGTSGHLSWSKVVNTSFTITSDNAADTSEIGWIIIETH